MHRVSHHASAFLFVLLACTAVLAAPAGSARADGVQSGADAIPAYGSALPRFALFGWVGPPRESTTVARYAELAATGFNVTLFALDETGTYADNRLRLDCSRALGLRNLLLDNDLDSVSTAWPASMARADTIVSRYKRDPAFLGYYLGDEPAPDVFPRLGDWFAVLRARDPAHPCWNSLRPRGGFATRAEFQAYLEQYVAATRPAVLCNNQYDFKLDGDSRLLTENVATMGTVARANGIPFWGVVQLVEHWIFRHVTPGMLRWQAAQWLAWGARGIGYFTYWTPPPIPDYYWGPAMIEWGTGAQTENYHMVTDLNARLVPVGNTLAGLRWIGTRYAGSVPPGGVPFVPDTVITAVDGRATLGWFGDTKGLTYLFLANADSLLPHTLTLTLADGRPPWRLQNDGSAWVRVAADQAGRVAVTLAEGDFTLLRFPVRTKAAAVEPPSGGAAPGLRVAPNPSFGAVRFEVSGLTGPARLEVLDPSGRVVWSRALPPGASGATWRGERDGGGRAAGGVYFARLHDGHGVVMRRIAWLGTR
jgi:hypothetical protein